MSDYDPQLVGRYGNLVEQWAEKEYPISLDYPVVDGLKFDGTSDSDGSPVDVKGSMCNGVRPTFKFWRDQHRVLRENSGAYLLVWYRAEGTEIAIENSRSLRAADIKISNWTYPGDSHHRSHSLEAQIPADKLKS